MRHKSSKSQNPTPNAFGANPKLQNMGMALGHVWNLRFGIFLGFGIWVLGFLPGIAAEPAPAQIQFFENKIRPLLANNCYKCHSQHAEKVKGGLLLDTKEGVLKGGENGPVIVPGDPEKSVLIKAVRYTDPDLQMPPKGKKLSDSEVADLFAWVKMGAPDPRIATASQKAVSASSKKHWAWQTL